MSGVGAQHLPQHVAQEIQHSLGARRIAIAHEHGDGIQTVEKEMGIELHPQRAEPRLGELSRQTDRLHFVLARFGEIEQGMLDSHEGEVDGHAKRQRRENPTGVLPQGVADGRNWKHQQPQGGAEARPSDAQRQRADYMNADMASDMRPVQRKSTPGAQDQGREERVQEPVERAEEDVSHSNRFGVKGRL